MDNVFVMREHSPEAGRLSSLRATMFKRKTPLSKTFFGLRDFSKKNPIKINFENLTTLLSLFSERKQCFQRVCKENKDQHHHQDNYRYPSRLSSLGIKKKKNVQSETHLV